jgi:hypothetical protein
LVVAIAQASFLAAASTESAAFIRFAAMLRLMENSPTRHLTLEDFEPDWEELDVGSVINPKHLFLAKARNQNHPSPFLKRFSQASGVS